MVCIKMLRRSINTMYKDFANAVIIKLYINYPQSNAILSNSDKTRKKTLESIIKSY